MGLGDYMHQQSLLDAYKKLYMLGHRSYSKGKEGGDEWGVGAAGGGMVDAYQQKLARDKAAMKALQEREGAKRAQEAADKQQEDEDVRYIRQGPEAFHEWQQVVAGNAVPTNPYSAQDIAKHEMDQQRLDKEREQTQIGGVYTPQGIQQADKEADLNASDRLMLRGMATQPQYGLGGSMMVGGNRYVGPR